MNSAFLIAAPMSGSGKTTVSRGLMALLTRRGLRVQPFKCGPDYIDTKFHAAVCRRPSINLDTFMATAAHVRELFGRYSADADVAVVEGMMGLYDGYDRDCGSSAEIARVLDLPVVLVVDARSAAYSMAALLQGFVSFRPGVRVVGVIFNQVGSERHARMLRQVCAALQLPCFGCLPKSAELEQASRYLGLDFSQSAEVERLVQLLEEHVSIDELLGAGARGHESAGAHVARFEGHGERKEARVATPPLHSRLQGASVVVARNGEAFSFVYQEVLDGFGAVRFFDPEREVPSLADADLLYLPGGYPEKHVEALVCNEACRKVIADFAEGGGRVVAECGGMMYLCRSIVDDRGRWPMCGVLPYDITACQCDRRLSLGYRRFVMDGREYRGHEFHYTQFVAPLPPSAVQVYNARGEAVSTPVLRYKNVLASYTHLYSVMGDG